MKLISLAAATAMTVALAGPALSADMVTARDPEGVLAALTAIGYQGGKLTALDNGRPTIEIKMSGLNTTIDFYDCTKSMTACDTMLFYVALAFDEAVKLETANEWNAGQILGRVSVEEDGDIALDVPYTTYDGVPLEQFEQMVKRWDNIVGNFKDFVNF